MKRLIPPTILLALAIVAFPAAAVQPGSKAEIPLPPPLALATAPSVVALPDAPDVYVVAATTADVFFCDGLWWRLWKGAWYRSGHYDGGWTYCPRAPSFYPRVDPDWRSSYISRKWHGRPWDCRLISLGELERNWKSWRGNGYRQRKS